MRNQFAAAVIEASRRLPQLVFLSGDLGFAALEGVRDALGRRFVNAGVAEQNMVGVAAGMARQGLLPIIYSIAPFTTLRPYEQLRNDVCMHELGVKVVGNGGGYGYGIMGATHHALEDIGVMRALPGMRINVPVFDDDVAPALDELLASPGPGYLRLNLGVTGKAAASPPRFAEWRRIATGDRLVVVACGPVVQGVLDLELPGLDVWLMGRVPFATPPPELLDAIERCGQVAIIEEHLAATGVGEAFAAWMTCNMAAPARMHLITAQGYPSGLYGSQRWHREESGLAGAGLRARLTPLTVKRRQVV